MKKDWRLIHGNWCDVCCKINGPDCKICKPPKIRDGYENKRASKYSVVPPSEWQAP